MEYKPNAPYICMAQVTSSISDKLNDLLNELAIATGIPKSSLIAEYIRHGIYKDMENQSIVRNFQSIAITEAKGKSDGKKAYILLAEKAKGKRLSDEEIEFIIAALPEYEYSKADFS